MTPVERLTMDMAAEEIVKLEERVLSLEHDIETFKTLLTEALARLQSSSQQIERLMYRLNKVNGRG